MMPSIHTMSGTSHGSGLHRTSVIGLLVVVLSAAPALLMVLTVVVGREPGPGIEGLFVAGALVVGFPIAGALIVRRQSGNLTGWSFLFGTVITSVSLALVVVGSTSRVAALAWLGEWLLPIGLGAVVIVGIHLYPAGVVRTRWDRGVLGLGVSVIIAASMAAAFRPEVGTGLSNPVASGHDWAEPVRSATQIGFGLVVGIVLVSKFVGNRRKGDSDKARLAALGWVGLLVVVALAAGFTLASAGLDGTPIADVVRVATWAAVASIPLVMILGEMKPGRVVIAAVVYSGLSMLIVAIHGVAVASVLLVLPVDDVTGVALVAAGAVAVVVQPLRSQVQRIVDRIFARPGVDARRARFEERERLRRELHDGLGSSLTAIGLGIHSAKAMITSDPAAAARSLEALADEAGAALDEVRRLTRALPPSGLEGGLSQAVEDLARRFRVGTSIEVRIDTLPPLPQHVETATYRVIEEALANVARHSRADLCTVSISWDGVLHVEIVDDGVGLSGELAAGVGLSSMRQRVVELGGGLDISSNRGVVVRAWIPVI